MDATKVLVVRPCQGMKLELYLILSEFEGDAETQTEEK